MPKVHSATEGTLRKRTPYNNFMSVELKRVKTLNPDLSHKEAFKKAAANWKVSPDNPINKK